MVQAVGSWRQSAAAALADTGAAPVSAYSLPIGLEAGLRALARQTPPRLVNNDQWRAAVRDALRLASEGWATIALTMGWTEHDVFGIGPVDDWEFSGLAVWLRGRSIVLLDGQCAVCADGNGRAVFNRGGIGHGIHPKVAPVMMWEFGR